MSPSDNAPLLPQENDELIPVKTSAPTKDKHQRLTDRLKRLGFANAKRMKLYGQEFELLSDPIVVEENAVFFEAIESRSRQPRRVRIPLNIVHMASRERQAA